MSPVSKRLGKRLKRASPRPSAADAASRGRHVSGRASPRASSDSPAPSLPAAASGGWRPMAASSTPCRPITSTARWAPTRTTSRSRPEREKETEQTLQMMFGVGYIRPEDVPGIPRLAKTPAAMVFAPLGAAPVAPSVVLFCLPALRRPCC